LRNNWINSSKRCGSGSPHSTANTGTANEATFREEERTYRGERTD
jgi:hypothetical protein